MCYFLGLQAPDTFSAHYCAYDHPVLQLRMARKLARWTCQFQTNQLSIATPKIRHDVVSDSFAYTFCSVSADRPCLDIVVAPMDHQFAGSLNIQINSRYGLSGTIICIINEEEHDE